VTKALIGRPCPSQGLRLSQAHWVLSVTTVSRPILTRTELKRCPKTIGASPGRSWHPRGIFPAATKNTNRLTLPAVQRKTTADWQLALTLGLTDRRPQNRLGARPMTIFLLATGTLTADPQRRESRTGTQYATATIRVGDGDEAILVSTIAFGEHAARLLDHTRGEPISVSGRAKLNSWRARDGSEKHGLSLTIGEIAAIKPRPRSRPCDGIPTKPRGTFYSSPKRSGPVPDLVGDDISSLFRDPIP
jgi:Single-strand binding protein family